MKALRWGLVCVAHGNKSSPVFSVGSAISSLPFRLPSRVCSSGSLGLLAQPVCLGQSLLLLLSKIPAPAVGILQLPAPPPFLRALGGSRGNTKQEHRERELMSSGMLMPEAGECTCMCVSVCADAVGTVPWLPARWPCTRAKAMGGGPGQHWNKHQHRRIVAPQKSLWLILAVEDHNSSLVTSRKEVCHTQRSLCTDEQFRVGNA